MHDLHYIKTITGFYMKDLIEGAVDAAKEAVRKYNERSDDYPSDNFTLSYVGPVINGTRELIFDYSDHNRVKVELDDENALIAIDFEITGN